MQGDSTAATNNMHITNGKESISSVMDSSITHTESEKPNPGALSTVIPMKETPLEKDEPVRTKLSIWKDVLALSLGFTCNYIPFTGLRNIQSSLNSEGGLGTTALGLTYISAILSSFVMPSLMIRALGLKWTIVSCLPFLAVYISSNFYATWYTLAPALVLWGFFGAPLWSAQFSTLNAISFQHARLWDTTGEVINSRFFGVFFMIFHLDEILGNLISSFILKPDYENDMFQHSYNSCGMNYCNVETDSVVVFNVSSNEVPLSFNRPTPIQVFTLCGVYVALSIVGTLIIAIFVHPVKRLQSPNLGMTKTELIKKTFQHILNPKQLLLIPLTMFTGLSQSFMASDFSKAFLNCVLGIHFIGYAMMWAGVTDAIFSMLFGITTKHIHRSIIYVLGTAINVSLYILMMTWEPQPTQSWLLYVIAGLWGISDAVWQTHFCGFYGVLFEDNSEVAYSVFQLWQFVGLLIGYFWSHFVCIKLKIYILLPFLLIGFLAYGIVEINFTREKKKFSKSMNLENNEEKMS